MAGKSCRVFLLGKRTATRGCRCQVHAAAPPLPALLAVSCRDVRDKREERRDRECAGVGQSNSV